MDEIIGVDGTHGDVGDDEYVNTVDVQILLNWFFDTADPEDLRFDDSRLVDG